MVTEVLQQQSQEEAKAKIREKISEMLAEVKAKGVDCVVLFAAFDDQVMFRYVGTPADIFNITTMGNEHVMRTFKLAADEPIPGQKLN